MTATERAALTDALTAASTGPSPPPMDRLLAAAEHVIDRAKPNQVILFGSASRGEFDSNSDFDFFLVEPKTSTLVGFDRWTHPDTGDEIDLVCDQADTLPAKRWRVGTIAAEVFALGATIYSTGEPMPTLRDQGIDPMRPVRESKYDLSEALDMTRRCRSNLSNADDAIGPKNQDPQTGCQRLQECLEKGLKALTIAHGHPLKHTHEIGDLLKRVRRDDIGENPPGLSGYAVDDTDLAILSRYGGGGGYNVAQGAADPQAMFEKFRPDTGRFVSYLQERVPALLDEHDRKRREAAREQLDTSVHPSAKNTGSIRRRGPSCR